jgi:hypothetical protein
MSQFYTHALRGIRPETVTFRNGENSVYPAQLVFLYTLSI